MISLSEQSIREQLPSSFCSMNFHILDSIDSTNQFLKTLPTSAHIDVCCAETQTQGRGRFGRHWHSPFGENIYCSSRWNISKEWSQLSGLGLLVSLAIVAALNDCFINNDVFIKWPNDLLWKNKKLCGNLIESVTNKNGDRSVIIGIGLNVNSITQQDPLSHTPHCSLYDIHQTYCDRNQLIARLLIQLYQHLALFMKEGLLPFLSTWHTLDFLKGKHITVSHPSGQLNGRATGVTETGQLILIDEKGSAHHLSAGDTSLR